MPRLEAYFDGLSAIQRRKLARLAGTSLTHITNIKRGHSRVGLDLAVRLERAMLALARTDATAPRALTRCEMLETCARCPHARR
jgi:outer membrane protein TolC